MLWSGLLRVGASNKVNLIVPLTLGNRIVQEKRPWNDETIRNNEHQERPGSYFIEEWVKRISKT